MGVILIEWNRHMQMQGSNYDYILLVIVAIISENGYIYLSEKQSLTENEVIFVIREVIRI